MQIDRAAVVPEEPLLTGAIGAAVLGKEIVAKAAARGESPVLKARTLERVKLL